MRKLIVHLSQLAGMQLVLAVSGIVRNKVLALQLGEVGMGEFNQVVLFTGTVTILVTFGMGVGLNRNAAAAKTLEEKQRVLASSNLIVLVLTLVAWSVMALALWQDGGFVGRLGLEARPEILLTLVLLAVFIPVDVLKNNLIAFLTGVMDIKGMTAGRSQAVIIGTVAAVPIIWYFGLPGAALQYVLLSLLIVVLLLRRCVVLGYRPWRTVWDRATMLSLSYFGFASLLSSFAYQFSDLTVRTALINQRGAAENGFYVASLSLVEQVRAVVLGSVGSYSLASLSSDSTRENIVKTSNQLLAAVLPLAALASAGLGLLSLPALIILYTSEFTEAAKYMPFLLAANFLQVFVWIIGAPQLALNMIRTWIFLELAQAATRWGTALWLLPIIGGQAVAVAYLVATASHLLFSAYIYFVRLNLSIKRVYVFDIFLGLAVVFAASYLGIEASVSAYVWGFAGLGIYFLVLVQTKIGLNNVAGRAREFLQNSED